MCLALWANHKRTRIKNCELLYAVRPKKHSGLNLHSEERQLISALVSCPTKLLWLICLVNRDQVVGYIDLVVHYNNSLLTPLDPCVAE